MTDPRYPIAKFSYTGPLNTEEKNQCLNNIEQTPARLREAVRGLPTLNSTLPTATVAGPSARLCTTFPTAT